jgi:flagellar motor protein MotB
MFVVFPPRGIGAAALAAGLLLAGCSSDSDVPPTVTSAPGGGTQMNTDTGSGGEFPDVNTTPSQRPTSTIQDLAQAPDGLAAAQGGTQYGEALVGGPTSAAEPPPPPPPPEPPQQALAPIPEAGIQTETSDTTAPETYPSSEQAETPQATEPQPEPAAEPEPVAEAEPAAEPTEPQGEGQTIQGTTGQAQPEPEVQPEPEPAPVASAPEPVEPVAPTYAEPQAVAEPSQPAPAVAPQQAQVPYGSNGAAQAPEAYGVSTPQPNAAPAQNYNSTQVAAAPAPAPSQGQRYGGEPVGLIYFRDGSSELSSDDRRVLEQIAEIQRAYGGVVSVIGHASVGGAGADQQANQQISEARANAVAQELMRFGVPLDAIRAGAAGDSQPLYSEAATNGEAGNRRVEVYITAY